MKLEKGADHDRLKRTLVAIFEEYDALKHLRGPSAFVYMLESSGYTIVEKSPKND